MCEKTRQLKAAKTCNQCAQPLHPNATPGTWCLNCAYPPCKCGKPRPQKGKLHAKQVPVWRCETCRKKCSSCGNALAKTNTTSTLCPTCSYPPCLGCGCPRPDSKEYHASLVPHWRCAACQIKPCSQCGQPLNNRASTDTLCRTCSFPPCASCGCSRPDSKEYHVKVLPSWTCAVCTTKTCVSCGKPVASHVRADAQCEACRFPPCSAGCGAPRPSQNSYYQVLHMPTWTCSRCRTIPSAAKHNTETWQGLARRKRRRLIEVPQNTSQAVQNNPDTYPAHQSSLYDSPSEAYPEEKP